MTATVPEFSNVVIAIVVTTFQMGPIVVNSQVPLKEVSFSKRIQRFGAVQCIEPFDIPMSLSLQDLDLSVTAPIFWTYLTAAQKNTNAAFTKVIARLTPNVRAISNVALKIVN